MKVVLKLVVYFPLTVFAICCRSVHHHRKCDRMPRPQLLSNPVLAERSAEKQAIHDRAERQSVVCDAEERTHTLAEVAKHNLPDSAWIAVNGKVPICNQQPSHCQPAYSS